ncbi:hypothetical protein J4573_46185 [Actinomadura barringtoniae]|uniref:Uncharacterized protein n=1 Tax=Actinomadura barringtoniae TaxID=1427535 RepID=A0A939PTM0_9ACTN|nr:hypothetical protein [Actinomadura barringtoniae]MBO2454546.1 hypothetical protein [Actinomadura barringtoniae]
MPRRRTILLLGLAAAAAGTAVVAIATTGQAKPGDDPAQPAVHDASSVPGQDPASVEKYWTRERMDQAQPAPMPNETP